MNALLTRTLTVVVLVPAVFAIILLPWFHHLAINAVSVVMSILGAFETAHFFSSRGLPSNGTLFPIIGGILPLAAYFEVSGLLPQGFLMAVLVGIVGIILAREIFVANSEEFQKVLPRVASSLAVVLYPGLFVSYIVRFSSLRSAGISLIVFLIIVFANDILAYLAGSLWGTATRGILPVSPNKSIVGFAGGMVGSLFFSYLGWLLFPFVFSYHLGLAFGMGAGVGILTIVGDLIESALKRSGNLKDSGAVIPGRGGVLDSIDSILFAAPFYYYLLAVFAGGGK